MTKSVSVSVTSRPLVLTSTAEGGQLEELDVALLDGPLVHHVAGDALEAHVDVGRRAPAGWATSFSSKAKSQPSTSTPLVVGASLPVPMAFLNSTAICCHVADADRRVDGADVDHAAGLDAVQPGVGHRAAWRRTA